MQQDFTAGAVRSPWIAIAGCAAVMTVVIGLTMVGLGVIVPQWMAELSLSSGQAMLVMTGIALLSGFGGIVVGVLVERWPAWLLLLAGVASGALALLLTAQTGSFGMLVLAMVPLGALSNALTGPVVGQAIAVRRMAKPGLAIAVVSLGMSLAGMVGPIVTAGLLANADWRDAMRLAAAIVVVGGTVLVLLMVRGEPGGQPRPAASRSAGEETATGAGTPLAGIALSATFLGAVLFQFPLMAFMSAMFFNMVLIYGELGGSVTAAAAMMSIAAAVGLAGTLMTGWLLDRVPHGAVAIAIVLSMATGHLILAFAPGQALLPVAVLLVALGNSAVLPLIPAMLAARFEGADFQRANGLFQPMLFGSIIGALVAGVMRDATGSYTQAFGLLLPIYVPVIAGLFLLARGRRRATL